VDQFANTHIADTLEVCLDSEWKPWENPLESGSLVQFLCGYLSPLWKDWAKPMKCITLGSAVRTEFSLVGQCPHCRKQAAFSMVTAAHTETMDARIRFCAAMCCPACLKYILGVVTRKNTPPGQGVLPLEYEEHYPLGSPDDSVDASVPEGIASDFAEAKRCLWVKAYRATVAMCRRSVEASCHNLGAQGKNLFERIDDLAKKGCITEPLKKLAHRVRLTGNQGLHGADDLDTITEADAKAIIIFTEQYFQHVYVMPELLKSYGTPTT
jgi:hypothetical protein